MKLDFNICRINISDNCYLEITKTEHVAIVSIYNNTTSTVTLSNQNLEELVDQLVTVLKDKEKVKDDSKFNISVNAERLSLNGSNIPPREVINTVRKLMEEKSSFVITVSKQ